MRIRPAELNEHFAELAAANDAPGASLAVLADGRLETAVTGVVNVETGIETTPDALFAALSITKSYVATAAMRLAEAGRLELDGPVRDILPEFRVRDADVTARVTPRHLLTHTSGIAGDVFTDTGRGDDALERYVEACAKLGQDVPFGGPMSYCNTGFSLLGRVIERITGLVWDDAMRELLFEPLGLRHTVTLPEDALRFRTAFGHEREPDGTLRLADADSPTRSTGPAGGIAASPADVIVFARHVLDGGVASDGRRLLSAEAVAEMVRPHVAVPEPWVVGDHWGLGWTLRECGGRALVGHGGNGYGQSSLLTMVPDAGVAIAVMSNGGAFPLLCWEVERWLLPRLCGIELPVWPAAAGDGARTDGELAGAYTKYGSRLVLAERGGHLAGTLATEDGEEEEVTVTASDAGDGVYVLSTPKFGVAIPLVAFAYGGERYVHFGARALRREVNTSDRGIHGRARNGRRQRAAA
jgi:CubicO group peptidase (beta-lactamase class C family)